MAGEEGMKGMLIAAGCWLLVATANAGAPVATKAGSPTAWRVLPGSTLGFTASYEGADFEGRFARFTPTIVFDPHRLSASRFDVAIELASADTRNEERDEALRGEGFFNSGRTPTARYRASRFRSLGGDRYVADGQLSLNGITRPVALAFSWSGGDKPVLLGNASVRRLAFAVGTGDWSDTKLIPDAVRVKTRLLLAAPAAK
jgi:polyisoprenoid-binding protein YceI